MTCFTWWRICGGYRHMFDQKFYSCRLGAAKPDEAYFRSLLAHLEFPPEAALFLDDN